MSAFTSPFQYGIGSSSHSNQKSKRIKRYLNWKGGRKKSLCADDTIAYGENPVDFTKKLLNLMSESDKMKGHKVNIEKLKALLYNNNGISETEIKNKIPYTIATRKIKYLGRNLTKDVKICTQKTAQH